MIQTDDLDKPLAERCDQFNRLVEVKQYLVFKNFSSHHFFFQKKKKEQKLTNVEVIKDLVAEAERLEIMEEAPFVVARCVFTENILKEIDEYKSLLTKVNNHSLSLFFIANKCCFVSAISYVRKMRKDKNIYYMPLKP